MKTEMCMFRDPPTLGLGATEQASWPSGGIGMQKCGAWTALQEARPPISSLGGGAAEPAELLRLSLEQSWRPLHCSLGWPPSHCTTASTGRQAQPLLLPTGYTPAQALPRALLQPPEP